MERRKLGQEGGRRVRRVIQREGVDLRVVLASQVASDKENEARLAAIGMAGDLLVGHTEELDFMRSGGVDATETFYMSVGTRLREATVAMDASGVEPAAITERVQRGLIAPGSSDPVRMLAITRTFVRELEKDRALYLAEKEASKAAQPRGPQA